MGTMSEGCVCVVGIMNVVGEDFRGKIQDLIGEVSERSDDTSAQGDRGGDTGIDDDDDDDDYVRIERDSTSLQHLDGLFNCYNRPCKENDMTVLCHAYVSGCTSCLPLALLLFYPV